MVDHRGRCVVCCTADGLRRGVLRFHGDDHGAGVFVRRPVGFDYRSKIEDPRWRNMWDWGVFIGSFVPPLVIGVAFGNVAGRTVHVDEYLRLYYTGNFFQLLNRLVCWRVS